MNSIIKELDISNSDKCWFDMWHTHFDWNSNGNLSDNIRKQFLKESLMFFNELKYEISIKYSRPYQMWILIDESDSGEDAVYLHTQNPNHDNFPLKLDEIISFHSHNQIICNFVNESELFALTYEGDEGKVHFLFDPKNGVSLHE